jgi:pimeloyl-ACP methyl ester carboxylesterase
VKLHVREWGDPAAPDVVCLHGATAHGGQFARLAEERLASRYHVIAPDLRGYGRSPHDPPWTLETYVHDVLELAPKRARWIGMSFGGRLLIELIARGSAHVDRAVLLEPVLQLPEHVGADMAAWVAQVESEREIGGELHFYSRDATVAVMGELTRKVPVWMNVPTLLVVARDSYLPSQDWARDLQAVDWIEVVQVPGGHDVLVEAFDETADVIELFLG